MPPPFSMGGGGAYSITFVPVFHPVQKMVHFGQTFFHTMAGRISSLMNASETRKIFHENLNCGALRMLLHENPQQFVSSFSDPNTDICVIWVAVYVS